MQIGKQFIWNEKEINILKESYSTTDNKILSRRFKTDHQTIIRKGNALGLRKIYKIKCKSCQKSIKVYNRNIVRCQKCQVDYTKKMTKERIARLREDHPDKLKANYDRWKLKASKV